MVNSAQTAEDFTRQYYRSRSDWQTTYKGYAAVKTPTDLWTIQELIWRTRPTLVVECGTFAGGSALFYADIAAQYGGQVVTIDTAPPPDEVLRPGYPWPVRAACDNLYLLRANSIDPNTLLFLQLRFRDEMNRVMVLLDSQHERRHVRSELELWAPAVTPGCYLVVEDTCINGHPIQNEDAGDGNLERALAGITADGGPMEAMDEWLATQPEDWWNRTRQVESLLTYNPRGYLLRC